MLLSAEPALALIREQGTRDLATIAIVAAMGDSRADALARLQNARGAASEQFDGMDRAARQTMAGHLARNVVETADRLIHAITALPGSDAS